MRIITSYDPKPVPSDGCDWSAVTDDYDVDCVDGEWHSTHPVGWGRTEAEAVADLKDQLGYPAWRIRLEATAKRWWRRVSDCDTPYV